MLEDYTKWPHLAQAFVIEKKVWDLKGNLRSQEKRFGITSLPHSVAGPKRLLEIAHSEWAIENQLHWRRDVLLREDWSQLRRGIAPQVNATLNNLVLGLIALSGRTNVAKARREFEYDPSRALDLLFKPFLSNS